MGQREKRIKDGRGREGISGRETMSGKRKPEFDEFCNLRECDIEYAKKFVKAYGVECRDSEDNGTPAHWAALNRNSEVLKVFIDSGANVHEKDKRAQSALFALTDGYTNEYIDNVYIIGCENIEAGTAPSLSEVFRIGVDAMMRDARCTPMLGYGNVLQAASAVSYMEIVEQLYGNANQEQKNNAIIAAAACGPWGHKALCFMLKRGANANTIVHADFDGKLIHMVSRLHSYQETLISLIEAGADIEAKVPSGNYKAIDLCLQRARNEFVYLLMLAGAKEPAGYKELPARFADCGQSIVTSIINKFKPRNDVEALVMREVEDEYLSAGLCLVRDFALEVGLAFRMHLPVSIICSILQAHNRMWPGVKREQYEEVIDAISLAPPPLMPLFPFMHSP